MREDLVRLSGVTLDAQISLGRLGDVKVFLPAGLLLLEDQTRVLVELTNLAPGQFLDVALAQSRETGKHEGSFEVWVAALGLGEQLHLFHGKILALRLRSLEPLNRIGWIGIDNPVLECLVQARLQFVEVRYLRVLRQPVEFPVPRSVGYLERILLHRI